VTVDLVIIITIIRLLKFSMTVETLNYEDYTGSKIKNKPRLNAQHCRESFWLEIQQYITF